MTKRKKTDKQKLRELLAMVRSICRFPANAGFDYVMEALPSCDVGWLHARMAFRDSANEVPRRHLRLAMERLKKYEPDFDPSAPDRAYGDWIQSAAGQAAIKASETKRER